MEISKAERLILANQFRILAESNPQDKHLIRAEILERGYEALYNDEIFNLLSEEMDQEEGDFVIDVLSMYRGIDDSYENLQDKQNLSEREITFPGFDGNYETRYYGFTKFFIQDYSRFAEIDERCNGNFNSHRELIPKYRRMLETWNQIPSEERHSMNIEQIQELLNA
ncbi:YfbU family protein [Oceanobacillus kapialis]|uniref:YfbU family protein n=2 Tax=Bacillati TaxID=1783272 RepID=A0ABW5PZN7_9BACI